MINAPVVDDVDAVVFVPVITPLVFMAVSVPTDVIVGCAAVVTVPASVAVVALVAVVAVAALPAMSPFIGVETVKTPSVPTFVKLEMRTFAASVEPVHLLASVEPLVPSSPLMPRTPCAPRLTSNSQPKPTGGD